MDTRGKWAEFDTDRYYRYALGRLIDVNAPNGRLVTVGLNPSTADENVDDATIRVLMGYCRRWGHSELVMLNLFAMRSTQPKALWTAVRPVNLRLNLDHGKPSILNAIGPYNDGVLHKYIGDEKTSRVLVAWGAMGHWADRNKAVLAIIKKLDKKAECLGVTLAGEPKHPLRQRADLQPVAYKEA